MNTRQEIDVTAVLPHDIFNFDVTLLLVTETDTSKTK